MISHLTFPPRLAAIAAFWAAVAWLPGFSPAVIGEEPLRLRVLSYNLHHGEGVDGKLDLERIAKVILSVEPDLVALQEIDQNTKRTEGVDQAAELARLTKMNFVYGPNIDFQGGKYGNAVLSRFPLKEVKNHLLPKLVPGEDRGALEVEVELPGDRPRLTFIGTHFDYRRDDGERFASAKLVNELAEKHKERPLLMAGDLNDEISSRTLKEIKKSWSVTNDQVLKTYPSEKPNQQIDFVVFRPAARWKAIETKVLEEEVASDHRPILAVLELLPE